MKYFAIFPDVETARLALKNLGPENHEIYSGEPLNPPDVASRLLTATVLGGLAGGAAGMALAVFTFRAMNLETGGMPIVAYPPTGIVVFALTALGAIGAALATLLWEAGLLRLRLTLPEDVRREIANGAVAVSVPEESREALEKAGARVRVI